MGGGQPMATFGYRLFQLFLALPICSILFHITDSTITVNACRRIG